MEDSNSNPTNDDENKFSEALDEFPFYDCADTSEINRPIPQSKLRRRRTFSKHVRRDISCSGGYSNDSNPNSFVSFIVDDSSLAGEARNCPSLRNLKENEGKNEILNLPNVQSGLKEEISENSIVTDANNVRPDESNVVERVRNEVKEEITENSVVTDAKSQRNDELSTVDSRVTVRDNSSSSHFLFSLAGLVIKAIGFQVNLLVSLITFPIWSVYSTYMFVKDPFHVIRHCKEYIIAKLLRIWGAMYGSSISAVVYEWFNQHKSILKLGLRCGWGLLWSVYVCVILVGLLVSAFVISGLVMRIVVEEPIQIEETLNFDYTKHSPVAFVPIISCPAVSCGMNCRENIESGKLGGRRVIPPNHKLQVTVSLTLPESEYNRNLGIFQVRVDLLSADGYALSSSRQHSMLQFKSQPIRLLFTFLNIAPLLTGFYSETQTLNINFKGLAEGDIPTTCLKVIIEQRAEFQPGAGIPEIYEAFLILESQLPLLKRLLWYWKTTIFIWLSMSVFTIELLFALLCCKPLIIPRATLRVGSSSSSQNRRR